MHEKESFPDGPVPAALARRGAANGSRLWRREERSEVHRRVDETGARLDEWTKDGDKGESPNKNNRNGIGAASLQRCEVG